MEHLGADHVNDAAGQVGVPGSTAPLAATSLKFETARNARRAAAKPGARLSSRAQRGVKVTQGEIGFRTDDAKSGQIAQTSEGVRDEPEHRDMRARASHVAWTLAQPK
jgi:hypothetical protein